MRYERNEDLLMRIPYPKLGDLLVEAITKPMLLNVLRHAIVELAVQ